MIAIALLLFAAGPALEAPTPSAIDTLCDPLARYAEQKSNVPKIFADLSEPERERHTRWSVLRDKAELDRRAKQNGVYTQGFVWKQDRGTYVTMFFTSQSGDWAEYSDFCYRPDGSLARSVSTLNTFNVDGEKDDDAPVSRIRTRYFTRRGRLVRSSMSVVNTKTRRPTKVPFMDQDDTLYRTMRQLPFAELLR